MIWKYTKEEHQFYNDIGFISIFKKSFNLQPSFFVLTSKIYLELKNRKNKINYWAVFVLFILINKKK